MVATAGTGDPHRWPGTRSLWRRSGPGARRSHHRLDATRWPGCWETGAGAGKVIRGLSHPQDRPLTTAGAAQL